MSLTATWPETAEMSVTAPETFELSETFDDRYRCWDPMVSAGLPFGISLSATRTWAEPEPSSRAELMAPNTSTPASAAARAAATSTPVRERRPDLRLDFWVASMVFLSPYRVKTGTQVVT